MDSQCEQGWGERVALFHAFALGNTPDIACLILPEVGGLASVPEADERYKVTQAWFGVEFLEDGGP